MIECNVSTHRVTDENDVGPPEALENRFEIVVEGSHGSVFRMVGFAVASEIRGDDVKSLGQGTGQVVPPVRVGAAPVKENERHADRVSPAQGVQPDSRSTLRFEVPGRSLHEGGSVSVREPRLNGARPAFARGKCPISAFTGLLGAF